ncbi:MAG: DsbC family protein [Syntrophaceae bacterium]|jgi:thiol:disulfide interchange protein DsbC|nr:DsbC family protein [Syntrophaceae bacterium]HOC59399.1 DsbC family protein [Smithellaceae bacterium]HQM44987.1 DsbC family protein [Smithellaceae bacterium]
MKKIFTTLAMIFLLVPGCSSAQKPSPEEQFKKSFPLHSYESFAATSVKGVYEIYNGRQIYYYLPEGDVLFLGSIITKDEKNLTQESQSKKAAAKMAKLDLTKAVKIGNGKTEVVEFIDPNCYYCRISFNFFKERMNDVTLYVFFFPLNDSSAKKVQHILCSKDPSSTYNEVLSGKLDKESQIPPCENKEAGDILKAHQAAAASVGVRGTPMFYIKGQVVPGFEQAAIEKLLKK